MRLVGAAERGMDLMVKRAKGRKAFGKTLAQQGSFSDMLAKVHDLPSINLFCCCFVSRSPSLFYKEFCSTDVYKILPLQSVLQMHSLCSVSIPGKF